MSVINDDLNVKGTLTATVITPTTGTVVNDSCSASMALARTKLAQDTVQFYGIEPHHLRVWDAYQTNLPGTAAADDLAVITGTWGTSAVTVRTSDAKATTVTQRLRFTYTLRPEYDPAETLEFRIRAGMITTVSDTTATVDVEIHETTQDGAVGADLVTTAAQSINSLTKANKDFTVTASGLVAGDQLEGRITIAITDGATATAVIGEISRMGFRMDIRG